MLLRSNFSPFPQYFQHIFLTKRVKLHVFFVKFGCSNGIFLNSANLICRNTDISKCYRESLRLRDNESRLYILNEIWLTDSVCIIMPCQVFVENKFSISDKDKHQSMFEYVLCINVFVILTVDLQLPYLFGYKMGFFPL